MNLKPVNGHILVELPAEEKGIYIPKSLSDSQQEGVVLSIAADLPQELQLAAGTKIRWEKYAEADGSFDLTLDGKKKTVVLIKSSQVMGVWQ